jgi:exopolysaccharide biosynthesis predicted pyruvyltransferase EpsI
MLTEMSKYLASLPDNETYHYLPNPGNAGDALIAHATFQLLEELNINYRTIDHQNFDPSNKILIYGGGGNLVPKYNFARSIIKDYYPFLKKLIILPHTIYGNEDILKEFGENVDIICREEISFDHVNKIASKSNVMLMDDMVFYLKIEDIISLKPISLLSAVISKVFYKFTRDGRHNNIPSIKKIGAEIINIYIKNYLSILTSSNYGVINCFRTDIERTDIELPRGNLDLSLLFQYGTENKKLAFFSSRRLLNFINQYQEIRTNRLHIAVSAALLGKKVKMYPNNYFKCEAVYQYSLKDKFKNVQWMG